MPRALWSACGNQGLGVPDIRIIFGGNKVSLFFVDLLLTHTCLHVRFVNTGLFITMTPLCR